MDMNDRRSLIVLAFLLVLGLAIGLSMPDRAPAQEEGADDSPGWRSSHQAVADEARQALNEELEALARAVDLEALAAREERRQALEAEARRELESRLAAAREEADRLRRGHDLYAAGMDKANVLFDHMTAIEDRVNKLKSELRFLESYVPVVRERITELDEGEEKEALEASLVKDLLEPIAHRRALLAEIEIEYERIKKAKEDYYAYYESRMQDWMGRMQKAQGKVQLLLEEIENVAFDVEDEHPEVVLDEAERAALDRATAIGALVAAAPVVDPERVERACLLCHYTADEAYFERGRLAYADHPDVGRSSATGDCVACHGGSAVGRTVAAAGHEAMVPVGLLADAPVGPDDRRTLVELGAELYSRHRCQACHQLVGDDPTRRTGSQLDGLQGWAHFDWLVRWHVDPDHYASNVAMPRYGLSEGQAQRISLYLWQFVHDHSHHDHSAHAGHDSTSEHAVDEKPPEGGGHDHSGHSHGTGPPIAAVINGFDILAGRESFDRTGCLGCHRVDGDWETVGVIRSLADEGRRLYRPYPPEGRAIFPAGTVIDKRLVEVLRGDGRASIDVFHERPLDPDLIDQRARLGAGYPADDPVYPAGTPIDAEVYEFLAAEGVERVALSGRGDDFAPDLTFAGDKLKKAHLTLWIENPVVHQAAAAMPSFGFPQRRAWMIATYLETRRDPKGVARVRRGIWSEAGRVASDGLEFVLEASTPVLAAGPEVLFDLAIRFENLEDPIAVGEFHEVRAAVAVGAAPVEGEEWVELYPYRDEDRDAFGFFYRFGRPGRHRLRISARMAEDGEPVVAELSLDIQPGSASLEEEGRKLVECLACAACHNIPGVEKPIGRDLTSRLADRWSEAPGAATADWLVDSIAHHRLPGGDAGPVDNYRFSEVEARALAAYVLDRLRGDGVRPAAREALEASALRVVDRLHCTGCHRLGVERIGGTFGPDLSIAGLRLQGSYLRRFLAQPSAVRPKGNDRPVMPLFAFSPADIEDLSLWLADVGRRTPAAAVVAEAPAIRGDATRGQELFEARRCQACHLLGSGTDLLDDHTDFTAADLARHRQRAPRLIDLDRRLDADWMLAWIKDPHRILPDTPMPDEDFTWEDAADVREYLLGFKSPAPPRAGDDDPRDNGSKDE